MHDSDAPEPDYLGMILTKTRNDRLLAYTIFSQLFAELPQQLNSVQQALDRKQYDLARQITHKLHGALSFCGLENMRKLANSLEQSLINNNYGEISRFWFQLQQSAFDFTSRQQTLLEALSRKDE